MEGRRRGVCGRFEPRRRADCGSHTSSEVESVGWDAAQCRTYIPSDRPDEEPGARGKMLTQPCRKRLCGVPGPATSAAGVRSVILLTHAFQILAMLACLNVMTNVHKGDHDATSYTGSRTRTGKPSERASPSVRYRRKQSDRRTWVRRRLNVSARQRTSALPSFLFVSKHGLQATASAGRSWHEDIGV
jgi:hypothetical protein